MTDIRINKQPSYRKRVVVTGMAVNCPIGDKLDVFYQNMIAGRSAVTHWKSLNSQDIYSKVGADLGDYDIARKFISLKPHLSEEMTKHASRLLKKITLPAKLALLCALDGYINSGLGNVYEPHEVAIIIAGHNFQPNYDFSTFTEFNEDPDFIDPMYGVYFMDTTLGAIISEALNIKGPMYTVGGACASGNIALRSALDEINHHNCKAVLIVGPILDYSPPALQALSRLGAISSKHFNEVPEQASRPFDVRREGFVPAHGTAVMIVEDLDFALARNANISAEVLGVASFSDATHLPQPSTDGQVWTMSTVLEQAGIYHEQINFISAHATSTPVGDLSEINAIKTVFGTHAYNLRINAPKSILGHCCWSSATIETIAAILQMQNGVLHPSINIDQLDPAIDLDICAKTAVKHEINYFLKNAFGFGGINAISLLKRFES